MVSYLDNLERACEGYKQLMLLDSPLLKNVVKTIMPTLKNHLDSYRPDSVIREEMLKMIFSKRYRGNYGEGNILLARNIFMENVSVSTRNIAVSPVNLISLLNLTE